MVRRYSATYDAAEAADAHAAFSPAARLLDAEASGLDRPPGPMNQHLRSTLLDRLGARAGLRAAPHRVCDPVAIWAIENPARPTDGPDPLGQPTSAIAMRGWGGEVSSAKSGGDPWRQSSRSME